MFSYHNSFASAYSLYQTLDHYGFSTKTQKKALENIMHLSTMLPKHQSLQARYPIRYDYNDYLKDILSLVQDTQKYFVIRTGNQERWEIEPEKWIKDNNNEILENAKKLGIVEKIMPCMKKVDAICILGTTFDSMKRRIEFASELINQHKLKVRKLILLAGERKVTIDIDTSKIQLLQIAKEYNIKDLNKLTETHLIKYIYKDSAIYNKLETFIIDTPAGNLTRPTTETTISELVKWLENHKDIKEIIFVSDQPYVKYQEAIITQKMKSLFSNIIFEVVGCEAEKNIETLELIESIGSYIWAKTPAILAQSNKTIANTELLLAFKKLYAQNALIYSDIESLFKSN